jgi:hypothetical protein
MMSNGGSGYIDDMKYLYANMHRFMNLTCGITHDMFCEFKAASFKLHGRNKEVCSPGPHVSPR